MFVLQRPITTVRNLTRGIASIRESVGMDRQSSRVISTIRPPVFLLVMAAISVWLVGCSRTRYRQAADAESYGLVQSRQVDPRWVLPNRSVEPSPQSRMYLATEQDCGPKPPDDQAAHCYMVKPDGKEIHYYDQRHTRSGVENAGWIDVLPRNADGEIQLTQPLAIDLGLINSREYQAAFENVYARALNLSGNRFEFDTQWFGGVGTQFTASGRNRGDSRLLQVSDRLGFSRNLACGGQFATEVLNGLSWDFGSGGIQRGSMSVVSTFTQPLLRGAFRHVRLENLTQAERDLLYEVRDFARFRRLFYVDLTEQYLGILTQTQSIRNTQTNVENLKQNLIEHEFYSALKVVSQVQVDQVFQQYQNGRRDLIASEQNLITLEDRYKFALGLPAWVAFEIDESLLEPFELVDPKLIELQNEAQTLFEALVQYLPPTRAPLESLQDFYTKYLKLRENVVAIVPSVEANLAQWQERLDNADETKFNDDDKLDFEQQKQLVKRVATTLSELKKGLDDREAFDKQVNDSLETYKKNPPKETSVEEEKSLAEILKDVKSFDEITIEDILPSEKDDTAVDAWNALENAIGRQLREEIAELYVAQTQIRLFLIDIEPRTIASETAITFAHQNRLDLMNSKAIVMDSFRRVEVAADALQSGLNVTGTVALGSDPNNKSPLRLDSNNNVYTVGAQFDGPLNRLRERNIYRASQIEYQQASRNFIANKDQIANDVRLVLRNLELSRVSFQIARQQVVAATRQVDQAQIDLRRSSEADSNLTIVLLQALSGLLDAKNRLVSNWVDYRVQKMNLFTALEMLYLDESGIWLNEDTGLDMIEGYEAIDPEYFPPEMFGVVDPLESPELEDETADETPNEITNAITNDESSDAASGTLEPVDIEQMEPTR
jgi:outer membrane protein TolC